MSGCSGKTEGDFLDMEGKMYFINRQNLNRGVVVAVFLLSFASHVCGRTEDGSRFLKGHQSVSKGVPIPKSLPGIWADINVMRRKFDVDMEDGNLSRIHWGVYAIGDHARAMIKKTMKILSPGKLEILKGKVKAIAELAKQLDGAADENDYARVKALLQILDKELDGIKNLYLRDALVTEGTYICPLHPEIISAEPGKCPKCGMDFVVNGRI